MDKDTKNSKNIELKNANPERFKIENAWSIRPCSVYKGEYDVFRSIKARFHQYFIHGKNRDCTQHKTDCKNCLQCKDSNGNDMEAGQAVVQSETQSRGKRVGFLYGNTAWKKRTSPTALLPEWMKKQKQLNGRGPEKHEDKSFCVVM